MCLVSLAFLVKFLVSWVKLRRLSNLADLMAMLRDSWRRRESASGEAFGRELFRLSLCERMLI